MIVFHFVTGLSDARRNEIMDIICGWTEVGAIAGGSKIELGLYDDAYCEVILARLQAIEGIEGAYIRDHCS